MFKNTIRNKLMLFLLAATILPIATSMIISYNVIKHSVTEEAIDKNASLLSLGKSNIINYMNNINQKSLAVYNAMNAPRSLYYIVEHEMEDAVFPRELGDVIRNRNLLKDHLYNIYQSVSEFEQVRLYVVKPKMTYLLIQDTIRSGQTSRKEDEFDPDMKFTTYIEPTHQLHTYGLVIPSSKPQDIRVFTLHRPIFRAPSDELIALLSIDINMDVIREISSQLYDSKEEMLTVVDGNGRIILSEDPEDLGKEAPESWGKGVLQAKNHYGHFTRDDDTFSGIVFYERIQTPYMNWTIVKQTPYKDLYQNADQLNRLNTIIAALSLAVAAGATILASLQFTRPIGRLIGYVNKIEAGKLNVSINIRSNDEIGVLARRFNSMMQTINNLILKEYRLELANRTNQLKALQAQVNPHFLYNALQSIGTLALQQQQPKIYSLLSSLGKMMRYQMNTKEQTVELSKELEYAQAYFDLQKQRFDDTLHFTFDVEEETRRVQVPKMILQPLVENYFKHGFVQQEGGTASVTIRSRLLADETLLLQVEDNGNGMSPERLQEITDVLMRWDQTQLDPDNATEHIGLCNVLSRLKIQFGERADMKLAHADPQASQGLIVTLHIPSMTKDGF